METSHRHPPGSNMVMILGIFQVPLFSSTSRDIPSFLRTGFRSLDSVSRIWTPMLEVRIPATGFCEIIAGIFPVPLFSSTYRDIPSCLRTGFRSQDSGVRIRSQDQELHDGSLNPRHCILRNHRRYFSGPLFSYISPDAPSFLLSGTRDTGQGTRGDAEKWIRLRRHHPNPEIIMTLRIFQFLCFHTHRRMHLQFCCTGHGIRVSGASWWL